MIIVLLHVMPNEKASDNRWELFHELTILMFIYHLICLTEWLTDMMIREQIGWSLITVISINFFLQLFRITL